MRIGILGSLDDVQVQAVARELGRRGAEVAVLPHDALDVGTPVSELDGELFLDGEPWDPPHACYVRAIPSAWAPAMERDGELVLYEDWFIRYMHQREKASYALSFLLQLEARGVRLVNGPHAGSVLQYKPFQLDTFRRLGAPVPATLISNDPRAVRDFHRRVPDAIYKPVMGGAVTRALDADALDRLEDVRRSPVIFQERVDGDDVRVMLAGDDVVSSVAIRTPEQHLDFRDDPAYQGGQATYEEVPLPADIVAHCRAAARACGLRFAGIDLKRRPDGGFVFLELNSSPIYLDVEQKLGHPISAAIARLLLE